MVAPDIQPCLFLHGEGSRSPWIRRRIAIDATIDRNLSRPHHGESPIWTRATGTSCSAVALRSGLRLLVIGFLMASGACPGLPLERPRGSGR
jgi:hypothetical protein